MQYVSSLEDTPLVINFDAPTKISNITKVKVLIKDVLMRKDHDTLHPRWFTDETDDEILGLPAPRSRANKRSKLRLVSASYLCTSCTSVHPRIRFKVQSCISSMKFDTL